MSLNFKPWYGTPYRRFNIFADIKDRKKRTGRMLAPNDELALVKAREILPGHTNLHVEERKPKSKK